MRGVPIKVIVFDFDGTLIYSNELKRDAYSKIFPATEPYITAINEVLAQSYEESRYTIIEKIMKKAGVAGSGGERMKSRVAEFAERYNRIVANGAKTCPARAGVDSALDALVAANYSLYLSSTTPEQALREIVEYRGWTKRFKDISGYPKRKEDTIRRILKRENCACQELLVAGDGESDRISAEKTRVCFFAVKPDASLDCLREFLRTGK